MTAVVIEIGHELQGTMLVGFVVAFLISLVLS